MYICTWSISVGLSQIFFLMNQMFEESRVFNALSFTILWSTMFRV